ncbi:MAG: hypothetical protein ABW221_17845 [Vicinamibacteria bacterium]
MSASSRIRSLVRALRGGAALDRQAPRPVRSAVLEYGRRRFVKSYRAHAAQEFARGEAIHRAAEASAGTFRAPRPLQLLAEHDLVVWEALEGLVELREHLLADAAARPSARDAHAALFERAGRALAAVHAALSALPAGADHRPFDAVRTGDAALDAHVAACLSSAPLRPLHWDFVCGNLFVAGADLVMLDASPNWYLHPPADDTRVRSPVYVDGGTLVFSLHCHPRFSPGIAREAAAYLDAFAAGYAAAGSRLDPATLLVCGAEAARAFQAYADARPDAARDAAAARRFRLDAADRLTAAASALVAGGRA